MQVSSVKYVNSDMRTNLNGGPKGHQINWSGDAM